MFLFFRSVLVSLVLCLLRIPARVLTWQARCLNCDVRRTAISLVLLLSVTVARYDALSVGSEWLINAYKKAISPLQGREMCNFWPTCSQFTKQAISSRGLVEGAVIGADRLMRCHPGAWAYLDRYYFGISHSRLNDPVSNHLICHTPDAEPNEPTLLALEPEAVPTAARPEGRVPESMLGFADYLYAAGDFERAATEYLRIAFADTAAGTRVYAGMLAGESYLQAGDYEEARTAFGHFATPALTGLAHYGAGRAWFAQSEYDSTRALLNRVTDTGLSFQASALAGWSLLKEHRFPEAARLFTEAGTDPQFADLARFDGSGLASRSRLAATLLSAALPGAGHIYAGRASDGIYSLITVAGSGLATWWFAAHPEKDRTRIKLSIFGAMAALFYAGNVYGANIAARDYNRLQQRQYLAKAEGVLNTVDLSPDYSALRSTPAFPDTNQAQGADPER